MKVLVVGSRGDEETGFVGQRLAEHGATFTVVDRDVPGSLAGHPDGADVVLLLGSDSAVHDPARADEVAAEVDLVGRARAAGRPVLGICYGGQLLARAAGARVARAERPEVGWTELATTDEHLAPTGPWFQFHQDRWWPSEQAASLATTALAPQAFVWDRCLAVQFHPEVTPTEAAVWVRRYTAVVRRAGVDPEQVLADIDRLWAAAAERCAHLVDDFLERVAGRPAGLGAT